MSIASEEKRTLAIAAYRDGKGTQAEIAEMKVEATAGGGMVTATVTGQGELVGLLIEKEVVDPEDIDMLTDLLIAAVQEAQQKAQTLSQEKLGPLTQGMNLPMM